MIPDDLTRRLAKKLGEERVNHSTLLPPYYSLLKQARDRVDEITSSPEPTEEQVEERNAILYYLQELTEQRELKLLFLIQDGDVPTVTNTTENERQAFSELTETLQKARTRDGII